MRIYIYILTGLFLFGLLASLCVGDFTNRVSYTAESMTLNSTNYVDLVGLPSNGVSKIIPLSGIKISNTNQSSTSIVSIIWTDGTFSVPLCQFILVGPTGVHYCPQGVTLSATNHHLHGKLDTIQPGPIDIEIMQIESTQFTP